MAYEIRDLSFGTLACPTTTYNSSTLQYTGVAQSTAEGFFRGVSSSSGYWPIVIIQNKPRFGESGEIWIPGCISKLKFGSTISAGAKFIFAPTGLGATTASAIALVTPIYGPTLQACTTPGAAIAVSFQYIGSAS